LRTEMVVQPVSTASLAERLALAFDTAEVVVPLPADLPTDMAAARQIKNSLAKSFGPAKAYKLGATIAAVQVTLGLPGPFFGALPASRIFAEGATVTGGGARQTGVESEYGFRLSRDITESNLPTDIPGLVECIDAVHPAIEIPGTRFASLGVHGGFALMADGGAAGALVLGPAQPFDPAADFNAGAVTLEIGGKPAAAGRGDIIVNGPLFPLLAFLKEALATGYSLQAGQVVVTGSCTGYVEVPRGELVVARFAALGGATVSMRFGAGPG
jgi:2-keto-4-pentenoate hydratase